MTHNSPGWTREIDENMRIQWNDRKFEKSKRRPHIYYRGKLLSWSRDFLRDKTRNIENLWLRHATLSCSFGPHGADLPCAWDHEGERIPSLLNCKCKRVPRTGGNSQKQEVRGKKYLSKGVYTDINDRERYFLTMKFAVFQNFYKKPTTMGIAWI
jgi:hypothetical protein